MYVVNVNKKENKLNMDLEKYSLDAVRQEIIDNHLQANALIQDILIYRGTVAELEALNEAGRSKLVAFRKSIEKLEDWAKDTENEELTKEAENHRNQFLKTQQAFRKANIVSMLEIEKVNREELMSITGETEVRQRLNATSRGSLVSQENNVTEKMLSISRFLSETTQKSAVTLDNLAASSVAVESTRDELYHTAGSIMQSSKLLKKYGRRECTDKMLFFFAFLFFLACVFYIVQKRLF